MHHFNCHFPGQPGLAGCHSTLSLHSLVVCIRRWRYALYDVLGRCCDFDSMCACKVSKNFPALN